MSKFLAGFAVASLLWGAAAALYLAGLLGPDKPEVVAQPVPEEPLVEAAPEPTTKRRRRRRGAGGASERTR